jgi:hypothetical protein
MPGVVATTPAQSICMNPNMRHPSAYSNLSPRRQPFIFLTSAFVAGILLDQWLSPPFGLTTLLLVVSMGGVIVFYRTAQSTKAAVSILAGFVAAGASISAAGRGSLRSDGPETDDGGWPDKRD